MTRAAGTSGHIPILLDFVMDPKIKDPKIEERGRVLLFKILEWSRQYILQDFGMTLNGMDLKIEERGQVLPGKLCSMGRVNKFRGGQDE